MKPPQGGFPFSGRTGRTVCHRRKATFGTAPPLPCAASTATPRQISHRERRERTPSPIDHRRLDYVDGTPPPWVHRLPGCAMRGPPLLYVRGDGGPLAPLQPDAPDRARGHSRPFGNAPQRPWTMGKADRPSATCSPYAPYASGGSQQPIIPSIQKNMRAARWGNGYPAYGAYAEYRGYPFPSCHCSAFGLGGIKRGIT